MELLELEIKPRELSGTAACKRYRSQGFLPLVVYSHGSRSVAGLVSTREFVQIAKSAKSSQVFRLKSEISDINGKSAVVKEIQKDFLKNVPVHVDLQWLREDEEISVEVVLKFTGEAPGVKLDGGILTVVAHSVKVSCLPKAIPDEIKVDVSGLHMGQSIHAQELNLPEGVKLDGNPEETIVSVVAVRQVVEETTTAAAPAEGEAAAAPAEGEAAAAPAGKAEPQKDKEKKE